MNTGRSAPSRSAASAATDAWSARGTPHGATAGSGSGSSHGAAWTSSGRLSTTVRRCRAQVPYARTTSSTADAAVCTRSGTAPTARTAASWSMRKLDRTAAPAVSAASTSSGVRLFAASAIPVSALVRPQPWCRLSTATSPDVRA